MSLPNTQSEQLFSAEKELPDFLPADDPMVVFSRELYTAFEDEEFAQCYSTKGRWATSPAFLACVTILQFRENLSDPETAEACVRRLDWKIALHLPVGEKTSFHPSTLCYYRKRLRDHEAMSLIFDKTVNLAQEKGFIKKRTSQRIDSTNIIAHVNRIAITDLLFRAVKCLTEEIEKKDAQYFEREIPDYIRERYSQRVSSFGMGRERNRSEGLHPGRGDPKTETNHLRSKGFEPQTGQESKQGLGWKQVPRGRDGAEREDQFHHQHDLSAGTGARL